MLQIKYLMIISSTRSIGFVQLINFHEYKRKREKTINIFYYYFYYIGFTIFKTRLFLI